MRMQFQNSRFAARYSLLSMFDYLPNTTHKGFVFYAPYYRKDLIKRVLRKNGRVFRFRKREQSLRTGPLANKNCRQGSKNDCQIFHNMIRYIQSLSAGLKRWSLLREEAELHMLFPPPLQGRGVMKMVTYSDLFQLGILIVNIIALIIQVNNKKK